MKKPALFILTVLCFVFFSTAQEENIVEIIDDLTMQWDDGAEKLKTYDGLKDYCRIKPYRDKTIKLLNKIHHYDTVLYQIVTAKFDVNQDAEAKATIDDIQTLEIEYTTPSFLTFLREECQLFNDLERNHAADGEKKYRKDRANLESDLERYVLGITKRIDVIDEHVHHLKDL